MSAFIVSTSTIDQIVSTFAFGIVEHSQEIARLAGKDCKDCFPDYQIHRMPMADYQDSEFFRLAADLHALNVAAVNYRYKENTAPDYKPAISPFKVRPLAETLKSVSCLLYQCAEGDFCKSTLYRALQSFEGFLALQIAQTLPSWQSAKWG